MDIDVTYLNHKLLRKRLDLLEAKLCYGGSAFSLGISLPIVLDNIIKYIEVGHDSALLMGMISSFTALLSAYYCYYSNKNMEIINKEIFEMVGKMDIIQEKAKKEEVKRLIMVLNNRINK